MTNEFASRSWTLRRRIARSFVGASAVVIILAGIVAFSTVQFVMAGNRVVYRWEPAVSRTAQFVAAVNGEEGSLRAYVLTGSPSFVTLYQQNLADQRRNAASLHSLVGSDATLRRQLASLEQAVATWHDQVVTPALNSVRSRDGSASPLVAGTTATRLSASMRADAATLSAQVEAKANTARKERTKFGVLFVLAIAMTALVFVLIGVVIWRGLHRWVLRPVDRLATQTREVARGDTYRQIVPEGPVELGRLGADVEAMRLQIAGQLAKAEDTQEELRLRSEELARSNDDLQQFAYVASHDLSEPLRKVANFCQLLERQYADQLDDRAKQYIDFAVDGAKRMQVLISDLLALSRVGRTTEEFVPVSLDGALDAALTTLADRIAEVGAKIVRATPLPVVPGDRALLTSLLENLVGNAVKYRREDVEPVIRIWAEHNRDDRLWTITIGDNGIGINPQFAERIFAVFQRLHLRDRYGGTGVGLALCRRIVEFHGGRIWLDPVASPQGATFRFTIPGGSEGAESRH
ncbi:MAG TPA: ATP-binding protein [Jatrophihabitans sp.]|nr:ATP-binding protein [Jatrophihabitans sp.]